MKLFNTKTFGEAAKENKNTSSVPKTFFVKCFSKQTSNFRDFLRFRLLVILKFQYHI